MSESDDLRMLRGYKNKEQLMFNKFVNAEIIDISTHVMILRDNMGVMLDQQRYMMN